MKIIIRFHEMQETMPDIYDVKDAPLNELLQKAPAFKFDEKWTDERKKLYYWYYIMATGQLIRELNGWAKQFPLENSPKFSFTGTLGNESTLPAVKMVGINFGQQKFQALSYAQLLKEINEQTGHGYFPLIIDIGNNITLNVDTHNPKYSSKTPALSLSYNATGYFFTRGWDPLGGDKAVQDMMDKAKALFTNPKMPQAGRTEADAERECPTVLGYYKPAGMAK